MQGRVASGVADLHTVLKSDYDAEMNSLDAPIESPGPVRRPESAVTVPIAAAVCLFYVAVFLSKLPWTWSWPGRGYLQAPSGAVYRFISAVPRWFDLGAVPPLVSAGIYLLIVAGLVPWLAIAALGRGRPHNLGLRRPNRFGWRIAGIGYLLAVPFLVWMCSGSTFAGSYLHDLRRAGGFLFISYYLANMLTEHFLIHGVLLAVCRRGMRWPRSVGSDPVGDTNGTRVQRFLGWVGMNRPTNNVVGLRRITRWMGLPDGCLAAIAVSAFAFALVHVAKDSREMILSIPGGVALAYLAYRGNSWLIPFVLHVATAGTAMLLILY